MHTSLYEPISTICFRSRPQRVPISFENLRIILSYYVTVKTSSFHLTSRAKNDTHTHIPTPGGRKFCLPSPYIYGKVHRQNRYIYIYTQASAPARYRAIFIRACVFNGVRRVGAWRRGVAFARPYGYTNALFMATARLCANEL